MVRKNWEGQGTRFQRNAFLNHVIDNNVTLNIFGAFEVILFSLIL